MVETQELYVGTSHSVRATLQARYLGSVAAI